ncbi:MAG: prepilin-type N-terminal cleavage/methylation domain-containing protein [Kiritimatiellales bacterium]
MNSEPKNGFTLIELLVMLGIISILSFVAVSSFSGFDLPQNALKKETRGLTELLKDARAAAVKQKTQVDVYADIPARTVYAVESAYARELKITDAQFFNSGRAPEFEPATNRFFRVCIFSEGTTIEQLAAQTFLSAQISERADRTRREAFAGESSDQREWQFRPTSETGAPLLSFTPLGSTAGSGIRLSRENITIELTCDALTGAPEIL